MKPKRRARSKTAATKAKHMTKLMGAAAINSHLEAIRCELMIYDMDWVKDGFEEGWNEQLERVAEDRAKRKT
jgi:hypothetical protein